MEYSLQSRISWILFFGLLTIELLRLPENMRAELNECWTSGRESSAGLRVQYTWRCH
jgi:hypothetical protein